MFYSQIILAKKGPLGKVWLAAHWGDKKLGRPQIFSTDISKSCDSIVHPMAPLALRVSGHLLLGVVRIYSRQVQYVLQDCQEAMIKIKLAFATTTAATAGKDKAAPATAQARVDMEPRRRPSEANLHVANFGEFTETAAGGPVATGLLLVEGGGAADHLLGGTGGAFAIPLDMLQAPQDGSSTNEWILAEDFDETQDATTGAAANEALETTLDSSSRRPDEEQWTAFDPDEEEDRHVFDDTLDTTVSDVEAVRAADRSADTGSGRPSLLSAPSLDKNKQAPAISPVYDRRDEEDDFGAMPMDDEEEDEYRRAGRDSSLALSTPSIETERQRGRDSSIGGLEAEDEDSAKKPKAKRKKQQGPKRMRKRRKVVIDNGKTQLVSSHIKEMLQDTSDICLSHVPFPSDWTEEDEAGESRKSKMMDVTSFLPYERLLMRPCLGDDGGLAPELLQVWERNRAEFAGKPYPFRMRGEAGEQQRREMAQQVMEGAAEAEEVEEGRRHDSDDDGGAPMMDDDDMMPPPGDEDDFAPPPQDDEEDTGVPLIDEEEEEHPANLSGGDSFAADMAAMGELPEDASVVSRESGFSLGAVNDFGEEGERQEAGGDLASSTSKWHKHTVKVLAMLKRNMKSPGESDGDAEEFKPTHLSYDQLSKGCSRRTSASVFFELLQLKTWDYIELDQDESYGDITIAPGVKFGEGAPAN